MMIFLFTLIDYAAFGLWILISMALSYVLVQKLNFFGGKNLSQKILAIGTHRVTNYSAMTSTPYFHAVPLSPQQNSLIYLQTIC